jgi:hypothetical protein
VKHTKPLTDHAPKDKLAQLEKDNSLWWANEAFLMKQFYSKAAKGCVSVGARNQPPGFCRSSQKDAIASYIVGASKRVPLPKHRDGTDVYCQVLADRLVSLGDDLSKDNVAEPKLYCPVYVDRKGMTFDLIGLHPRISRDQLITLRRSMGRLTIALSRTSHRTIPNTR